ncbi:hypothetical protein GCM10022278_21680 [Allohahella marinimesophila]|uniref:Uncharacterized protein n=1 Tax=Allohahella marinimesophila TaxID=1054972 RepID=A0ABP7PCX0_9GAMM
MKVEDLMADLSDTLPHIKRPFGAGNQGNHTQHCRSDGKREPTGPSEV